MAKNNETHLFTSESVSMGHPDKVADQISDAVLDAILAQDKRGRVACETMITTGIVMVAGEITTDCWVDIPEIVRETVKEIGYTDAVMGFDYNTCSVVTSIDKQSADIAMGVNSDKTSKKEQGAGDQGMMFGFACNETPELMPMPIVLSHKLMKRQAQLMKMRKSPMPYLYPDGKSQVTLEYQGRKPKRIDTIVVSVQHADSIGIMKLRRDVKKHIIDPVVPKKLVDKNTRIFVNPTGRFVIGGPHGDCGLTGRKIIVDTYGGRGRHGGGAFSGKDPSKVDRSATYAARWVAKNIVAAKLAQECEVQLSYAIGVTEPTSLRVDTFGTGKISDREIEKIVSENFDLTPNGIIKDLNLLRPIYKETARFGHFGRNDKNFTWENPSRANKLRKAAGIK